MTPVVNGLEAEFGEQIQFEWLNAADGGRGETAFQALHLAGYPAFVLFDAGGQERARLFGILNKRVLRNAMEPLLAEISP